jgi:predicted negative regulator of RcsB-dependent stress response
MRRSERHHLKENALAVAVARFQHRMESSGTGLAIAGGVALAVLVLFGGYSWWSVRAESTAGALLAEALVVADAAVVPPPAPIAPPDGGEDAAVSDELSFAQPPGSYPTTEAKMSASLPLLLEAADAYPDTTSGVTARYRAAAALAALGRHDEAAEQYRGVIDRDETGVYGRMATLGLASVQMSRGSYEAAIALLEPSSGSEADAALPVDGVLMQLGRAYQLAGRSDEARAAFQRVMDEFPTSLYFTNAQRELQVLQIEG